ncbi:hypothetical protein LTR40_013807, partial [Exophiala xenobiotica]
MSSKIPSPAQGSRLVGSWYTRCRCFEQCKGCWSPTALALRGLKLEISQLKLQQEHADYSVRE